MTVMTVPHPRAQRVVLLAEPRPPGPPGGPHSSLSEKGARMTTVPQRKQMETGRELNPDTRNCLALQQRGILGLLQQVLNKSELPSVG